MQKDDPSRLDAVAESQRQKSDTGAQVRIRCDEETVRRALRNLKADVHQNWLDGCICKLCSWFDALERGWFTEAQYSQLLGLYLDTGNEQHGDGFYPPGYSAVKAWRLGPKKSVAANWATQRAPGPKTQARNQAREQFPLLRSDLDPQRR